MQDQRTLTQKVLPQTNMRNFKPTSEDINSLANSWSERISSISKTFV